MPSKQETGELKTPNGEKVIQVLPAYRAMMWDFSLLAIKGRRRNV